MIVIERNMKSEEIAKTAEKSLNQYFPHCQASFNSDGNITLRNYARANKNKDQIIILSNSETMALFALFSKIGQMNKNFDLPF